MPIGASIPQHTNAFANVSTPSSTGSSQYTTSRYHSRVHHWTIFIDNYEILSSSISKQFTLLNCTKDFTSQRRFLSEVDHDIFECKQAIEEIEREIDGLPYNLRSKAAQTVDAYKDELEGYYALLLAYRAAHNRGHSYIPTIEPSMNQMNSSHTIHISSDQQHNEVSSDQDDSPFNDEDDEAVTVETRLLDTNHLESARDQLLSSSMIKTNMRQSAAVQSLDRSSRSLIETIEMGEMSNHQLLNQRESFLKQRDQLVASQDSAHQSMRTLDRVRWRAFADHMLSWFVVFIQIVLFVIVAYLKYFAID